MSKRTDIKSVLIIGAGPIQIGQGSEFDYSGVQACKVLKGEGYRIILINSNPATIMTDPTLCDATYIEPLHWETIAEIIQKERPDALLPTMGGQTALNCTMDLIREGILQQYSVELIGANETAIQTAEDRELFRTTMKKMGLDVPKAEIANNIQSALSIQKEIGFPTIIRPSFTLGGEGSGIAHNEEEFINICTRGLNLSPRNELLIEESLLGWKEFELEVIRDKNDNCIIVCPIENLDPMGIHTGDSITVAPAQTLTDKEYQQMRNQAIAVLREVGVETGGANVQFALNPKTGRLVVIEMNPRVSRSSALASKATGFPIAKVAAKLAVGYTLDELKNDITKNNMPASFEPAIDYVVTKIPHFNFEKFKEADRNLTTQMKSVGEIMAIGRTFQESLQKALVSLEKGFNGLNGELDGELDGRLHDGLHKIDIDDDDNSSSNNIIISNFIVERSIKEATPSRLLYIAEAFRMGLSLESIHQLSNIDPWFLTQIQDLVETELNLSKCTAASLSTQYLLHLKQKGFTDKRIAELVSLTESEIRNIRCNLGIRPIYNRIDTCAGEFPSDTAYLYSSYEDLEINSSLELIPSLEINPSNVQGNKNHKKIIILGSGPNRIGQGLEFDYCCVHATQTLKALGYETIMINCNPETVSTDYDVSTKLYFEPLTVEHVLNIVELENPMGVIVQYGGQTPLKLTRQLNNAGIPILGTSAASIDLAEDRLRFSSLLNQLNLKQPKNGIAYTVEQGLQIAHHIGYPLMLRPSYVLGGRAMKIVHHPSELEHYLLEAVKVSDTAPVLLEQYLENAIEVDIDIVSDGKEILIGGILEQVEYAGIHSGDSICSLPPFRISKTIQDEIRHQMTIIVNALAIIGPANGQFAIKDNEVYVLEINPRASRTIPFISKAIGIPLAEIGVRCMVGQSLKSQGITKEIIPPYFSVKLPVFPFHKFPNITPTLGPEMKSIGESMGIGETFEEAYIKSTLGINPCFQRHDSYLKNHGHFIKKIPLPSKHYQYSKPNSLQTLHKNLQSSDI